MGKLALIVITALAGVVAAGAVTYESPAANDGSAWFTLNAKVTRIVDGDTLIARAGRRSERVRLIGIDTPEVGACYAIEATRMARAFAFNRRVVLRGDRTQSRRDRYNRLLAYVQLPNRHDLGHDLILAGRGRVYVYDKLFVKYPSYTSAEQLAKDAGRGLWSACAQQPTTSTTTTTATSTSTSTSTTATTTTATTTAPPTTSVPPPSNCSPSYPDVCIPPPPPDLDCGDIPYRNFRVIYNVPNPDPHRFDGDHDGIGCET
jgi:micrococcal nuclease